MSTDCVFCGIVAGDIPGRIVHQEGGITAFLDANPLAPGHTLVVPDDHAERLGDLGDAASAFYRVIHDLVPAVEDATGAPATTVAVNNGEVAGQEVPHAHCHIVPRFENDGGGPIHAAFGGQPTLSEEELDAAADGIRDAYR